MIRNASVYLKLVTTEVENVTEHRHRWRRRTWIEGGLPI
jgi:hypothetical protein